MSDWKALSGRITAFFLPPAPAVLSALETYRRIWGGEPDSFQRSDNALAPSVAAGNLSNVSVNCSVQATRIDLNVGPLPRPQLVGNTVAFIDEADQLQTELRRIISALDTEWGVDAMRVALAVQLGHSSKSFGEANGILKSTLPNGANLGLSEEEDFVLQFNRPYASQVASGIRMNFIIKWAVQRFQSITFQPAPPGTNSSGPFLPKIDEFAVPTLTIESNSVSPPVVLAPGTRPNLLTSQQQVSLLNEALQKIKDAFGKMGLSDAV